MDSGSGLFKTGEFSAAGFRTSETAARQAAGEASRLLRTFDSLAYTVRDAPFTPSGSI